RDCCFNYRNVANCNSDDPTHFIPCTSDGGCPNAKGGDVACVRPGNYYGVRHGSVVKERTINVREYFVEDIIQLLGFQLITLIPTSQKQTNKNRKLQHYDNGYHQRYKHS
ncbi:unnamed protein product, partial [Rotaria sordida]